MPVVAKVVKWSISDTCFHKDARPPFPDGHERRRERRNERIKVSTWLCSTWAEAFDRAKRVDGTVVVLHPITGLPCELV